LRIKAEIEQPVGDGNNYELKQKVFSFILSFSFPKQN